MYVNCTEQNASEIEFCGSYALPEFDGNDETLTVTDINGDGLPDV